MNKFLSEFKSATFLLMLFISSALMQSCVKNEFDEYSPADYDVVGKVEKGPFINGSTISLQSLDVNMLSIGSTYTSTITDNKGTFSFGTKRLNTPLAQINTNGYFYNEVTGDVSNGTIALRAIVNLSDTSFVNVNVLTHLIYQRVLNLVKTGIAFDAANKQAQTELITAFGLQDLFKADVAQISIIDGTYEAGALIAISSLLMNGRSEAQLTEYLSQLSIEFAIDGTFSMTTKENFVKDIANLKPILSNVSANVIARYNKIGVTVVVKDLSAYVDLINETMSKE